MKILNLKALALKAKTEHPSRKDKQPPKAFKVETYFEQDNKKATGWCALVKGLKMDGDKQVLELQFGTQEKPICYTEVDWKSKKGEKPVFGIRRYFLVDGIFKIRITKGSDDEKGKGLLVAVENGEAIEMTETQVFSIFEAPENLPQ
jgi:hypothetical protein